MLRFISIISIKIGNNVLISDSVRLYTVEHQYGDVKKPPSKQGVKMADIVIEDNVWLGSGAVVLQGVRLGKGSVIGAGAVVMKDVPPHTVVAGVPARVIKRFAKK